LLGIAAALGILIGLVVVFFVVSPKETEPPSQEASSRQSPDAAQPSAPARKPSQEEPGQQPAAGTQATADKKRAHPDEADGKRSSMPLIALPPDADQFDLEGLVFPALPYSIYTGAYKDLQEAATTQSELDSNYLDAYIVPIEVSGNVAQSLFGVTQDGTWYRVMTGQFPSKQEARRTLEVMMVELPGYQPEIMRFPYALECGRFLEYEEARQLTDRLDQEGIFHYTQRYPASEGGVILRTMVGCYFSEQGARDRKQRLEERGFSCGIVER
jgi:cell division septation protein DedD